MELSENTAVSVDIVRKARLSLRLYKACGDHGSMPVMVMAIGEADWHCAVVLHQRIANTERDQAGVLSDDVWCKFHVRVAVNMRRPCAVQSILKASAKQCRALPFHQNLYKCQIGYGSANDSGEESTMGDADICRPSGLRWGV